MELAVITGTAVMGVPMILPVVENSDNRGLHTQWRLCSSSNLH